MPAPPSPLQCSHKRSSQALAETAWKLGNSHAKEKCPSHTTQPVLLPLPVLLLASCTLSAAPGVDKMMVPSRMERPEVQSRECRWSG